MDPLVVGIAGILLLLILLFMGMPVGFCMALVGFAGFSYIAGTQAGLGVLRTAAYTNAASYSLSVIPIFILMGQFAHTTGISRDLYQLAHYLVGQIRGGLSMATFMACAGFGAVCGSGPATTATMGSIALPEMRRYGYSPSIAGGTVAAGAPLATLIPPSVALIVYGIMTEVSIGRLFLAGIIPGVLLALIYCMTTYIWVTINPNIAPKSQKYPLSVKLRALKVILPVSVIFIIMMGGLMYGLFTPTEAAGVGAFSTFIYALIKRKLSFKDLMTALEETARISVMIFIMIIGAMIFGYFLTITRLPYELSGIVAGLGFSPYLVLCSIILVYLVLGCIMDEMAMILLTLPIFHPLIVELGFSSIWFGVVVVLVMAMGNITPPVGINVLIIGSLQKDVSMYEIYKGIMPYLLSIVVTLTLLTLFPQIALLLPQLLR